MMVSCLGVLLWFWLQNVWKCSPRSLTAGWKVHGPACDWSTRRATDQSRLSLFRRENPEHQNKLPLVRHPPLKPFSGFFITLSLFSQRGQFKVFRDEKNRLKKLIMFAWRLILMCVAAGLRAASSQTQEGRTISLHQINKHWLRKRF